MKQSNWIEKGMWGLLIVLNALFLYYWVELSLNYSMHHDDVLFSWMLREMSMYDYVKEMYLTNGGNFVSYYLNGILFSISNIVGTVNFWPIVFYCIGIVMTWMALRELPCLKNSGWKGWVGVITLYNIYILTSVDYAVFTWICAMEYYLYAPALAWLMRYLVKPTLRWWQTIALYALAVFIAGNSVSISTTTFLVLFAYGMYIWYGEKWSIPQTWAKPQIKRLLAVTFVMLVLFAIVYVAPGNWIRMKGEADIQQPSGVVEFIIAIGKCFAMFFYMMVFYLPYHLMAVALGLLAGKHYPMVLSIQRRKAMIIMVAVSVLYIIASVIPLAYISNGFQIQRNYIQVGFFYILTFFLLGYVWSSTTPKANKSKILCMSYVCAVFMIVIMCLNVRQDIPVAKAYHEAYAEREQYLLSLNAQGQKETVVVKPLPSTSTPDAKYNILGLVGKETAKQAIYYETDTDTIPKNLFGERYRKLLNLDYDFVLAKSKK